VPRDLQFLRAVRRESPNLLCEEAGEVARVARFSLSGDAVGDEKECISSPRSLNGPASAVTACAALWSPVVGCETLVVLPVESSASTALLMETLLFPLLMRPSEPAYLRSFVSGGRSILSIFSVYRSVSSTDEPGRKAGWCAASPHSCCTL